MKNKTIDVEPLDEKPKKASEVKESIKTMGKEMGLAVVQGLAFSFKTIRQGLKWASEDDAPKQSPKPRKKGGRNGAQVIIIR